MISFAIGAGIVGCIWTGTAFIREKSEISPDVTPAPAAVSATMPASATQYPNRLRKPLSDAYSAIPDRNFPGIKLYDTDFLIPWNRTVITEYAVFDDPKDNYGSGNAPMSAFMFRVEEKGKSHYFMTAGMQWREIAKLVYLGENIKIEKVEPAGNGYLMATYKDPKGRIGRGFVPISHWVGVEPTKDTGVAQNIQLDPLLKYAEMCDPFVWKMTAEELWKLLQKSLRENDKMTIAKMITFPMEFKGETIYTRAEFVEKFDEIFFPAYKEFVLKSDTSEIWYSWRGAGLPDNCSWCTSASKGGEAGPISLYPERWLTLQAGK